MEWPGPGQSRFFSRRLAGFVIRETVVEFGPAGRFVGILSRLDSPSPSPADLGVLITNAGIIHRVGPHRLHVRLGRHLAAQGYPCVRYDLPGIGDSEGAGGEQVAQMTLAATSGVLDRLQRMGVARRFVILGICSGADHSLMASVVDPRIVGAVVIDPTTVFSTARHRMNRLLQRVSRLFVPRVLWRLVTGRYGILKRMAAPQEPPMYGLPRAPSLDDVTAHTNAVQALRALTSRRVRLYMVMTGHTREVFSYRRQIVDAFPEVEGLPQLLRVERMPWAGHTFGRDRDRQQLIAGVLEWLAAIPADEASASRSASTHA